MPRNKSQQHTNLSMTTTAKRLCFHFCSKFHFQFPVSISSFSVVFEQPSLSATQSCIARQFVSVDQTSLHHQEARVNQRSQSPYTLCTLFHTFYNFNSHAKSTHTPSSDLIPIHMAHYVWTYEHIDTQKYPWTSHSMGFAQGHPITILNTCQYTTASVPCYP